MRKFRFLLVMAAAMLIAGSAWANAPTLMNVQGILTDGNGVPLVSTGRTVEFTIYDGPGGGAAVMFGPESHFVSTDAHGRFTHILGEHTLGGIPHTVFSGDDRWLGIKVSTDPELTPRIHIVSDGYSFRVGSVDHSAVNAEIAGTSYSLDAALYTDSTTIGIYANAWGDDVGGYSGVYSLGEDYGVLGYGIPATGSGGSAYGVYGYVSSTESAFDYGVVGYSDDYGVYGSGADYGVYGSATSYAVYGAGGSYGGYFSSASYDAVRADASGGGAVYAVDASADGITVYANTTSGIGDWGFYTPDDIFVGGACTGCLSSFAARNGGDSPLEAGTPVAIMGVEPALQPGGPPVMVVRQATAEDEVIGVVRMAAKLESVPSRQVPTITAQAKLPVQPPLPPARNKEELFKAVQMADQSLIASTEPVISQPDISSLPKENVLQYVVGSAAPGQLLTIVTHGPTYVKASGPTAVGELLAMSSESGKVQSIQPTVVGGVKIQPAGVIGKVLGPADPKTGLVPVLVTLK